MIDTELDGRQLEYFTETDAVRDMQMHFFGMPIGS